MLNLALKKKKKSWESGNKSPEMPNQKHLVGRLTGNQVKWQQVGNMTWYKNKVPGGGFTNV